MRRLNKKEIMRVREVGYYMKIKLLIQDGEIMAVLFFRSDLFERK